ncbi:glycosyltransferase [Pedobacter sp.]|uniref:glycosyltransferase n=1 Tax=Pedobacter sp. TaxID=1411316 RepID=UPI003D7FBF41
MKILHLTNNLGSGGSEKLLTDILPLMKEEGHEVHLAYANANRNVAVYEQTLRKEKIRLIDFGLTFYNPLLLLKLVLLLQRESYDIVHAHIFPTQYWLAMAAYLKPAKTRLVKTEHNVFNNRRKRKQLLRLERWVYQRYASVIAITAEVAEALETWLGNYSQIVVIPNGVNLRQLQQIREGGDAQQQNAYDFLDPEHYNLLMTGRFNGHAKDQQTLIKALRLLPENFHLFFAGEGELMNEAKELVKKLQLTDRTVFLGLRTDVYQLMNAVDLNVLSTKYEGLSGVTLEALASGKPFIGSDVHGVNTIVPDGRFLFPPQKPDQLAAKVVEIAMKPALAADMVKTALAHVTQFDISHMVRKYLAHYQQVSL